MKLDFNDVLVMSGLGLFGRGLWMIDPATSLAAVGAAMMVIAYLRSSLSR